MSSTSSSDYDCSAGFCYDSSLKRTVDGPIYPCVGRCPVVYYAHIPQGRCTNRDRISKKNNPNCFVKAFRWYTQELQSPRATSRADDVNVSGFANWLDKKYKEFLHESEREQNYLQFRSNQRSNIENNSILSSMEFKPRKTKKFSRMRSSWKKKRRFGKKSRDSFCEKHSFNFILRPQDLSRPASECCLKSSCCNRSDATYVTSRNAFPAKIIVKSHSTMCITKTRNMLETQVDVITYNVNDDCQMGQTYKEGTATLEDTKLMNAKSVSKEPIILNDLSVSCDCLEDLKMDASLRKDFKTKTQVLTNDGSQQLSADRTISSLKTHVAKETRFVEAKIITDAINKDQHDITTKRQTACCQCSLHNIETKDARDRHYETEQEISKEVTCIQGNCKAPCCPIRQTQAQQFQQRQLSCVPSNNIKAFKNINNEAPAIIKDLSIHSVQTSDHSIVIEQDDMSGFPLFMKIVCGNRLCQESTK